MGRLVLVLAFVCALVCAATASLSDGPSFDVSRYFSAQANSTCGDPPTTYEPQFSGALANCSAGQFSAGLVLDGDPATGWLSAPGEAAVALTLSLEQVRGRGCANIP